MSAPRFRSACTERSRPGEVVGKPCDECGHLNMLHPGPGNPALRECLVCVIERKAYAMSTNENVLPVHPACGHRIGTLGCRTHHEQAGEPAPDVATALIGTALELSEEDAFQAVEGLLATGYVTVSGVQETAEGPRVIYRLTDKGKARAENLLGLPPGSLGVAY